MRVMYEHTAPAALERFTDPNLKWLKSLPVTIDREEVALLHASPGDLWRAPLPDRADEELLDRYEGLGGNVVVYGHIHRPFVRTIGSLTIANSGSVGLTWDGDNRASYLLIVSKSKSAFNVLSFFKWIRRRYPRQVRIYLVMDNLSSHWTDDIRSWAKDNNVVLVATPTYASWLNPIESQFGVMVDFVFSGSNYKDHNEIEQTLRAYLKRRNSDARRNLAARQAEKAKRQKRRRDARAARVALAPAA